jgi:hypothetical protein
MTAVCLLVGSAVGALCNPPLLRHPVCFHRLGITAVAMRRD